ncbi:MAG: two-component system LytT family sensor histidine kinase LytS [Erysipelotrichaceae bacterium]|nr:MAG: two-component system LytT family sensor histidine kinase [Erysipelotrichaceae bacterium]TXT18599.1 MAG: two-component system LytT family sensor histidine kinase LytS [Erysipelotrichaceae bacterium]
MFENIFNNIILNIAILLIMGNVIPRIQFFRETLFRHERSWKDIIILSLVFGGLGILSTYMGININGAIVNTRVIGVITGGLLGGPWVGLFSGLIAGGHRFLYDLGGFTALSCGLSTLVEGILGGLMYIRIRSSKNKYAWIYGTTFVAEILQMIIILIVARPFDAAVELVKIIAIPMIFLNALGSVIFIQAIFSVQRSIDAQSAKQLKLAFDIAKVTSIYTQKGLESEKDMHEVARIVRVESESDFVMITTLDKVIAEDGNDEIGQEIIGSWKPWVKETSFNGVSKQLSKKEIAEVHLKHANKRIFVTPIIRNNIVVGSIIICDKNYQESSKTTLEFTEGLSRLLSTQLELSEIENQRKLVQKAELKALHSQINPHFLFNALNTIAATSRENPDRARQLIIALASYFRNTLSSQKELIDIQSEVEHVLSYIEIEKARFEDRLDIQILCDPKLKWEVPNFIIQPLIENSIKHGMKKDILHLKLTIAKVKDKLNIEVWDDGGGMDASIIERLYSNTSDREKIGLANIHNRLKSIYPNHKGLVIETKPHESTLIKMRIPSSEMKS